MTGYIVDYEKNEYVLPPLLMWDIEYTDGNGADSFETAFVFTQDMSNVLHDAVRFRAEYENETVFYGVIDEYGVTVGETGMIVNMCGRGLAALLLDNETEAREYVSCGLDDIIANHVRSVGITDIETVNMPAVYGYSVPSGSSQYAALRGYTEYACGILPRFSKEGSLILSGRTGERFELNSKNAYQIKFRDRRYGVISKVVVKNVLGSRSAVENSEFIKRGGQCERIVLVPKKTGADAMRYTGKYQIEKSKRGSVALEISLPVLFAAFPADIISVNDEKLGICGEFTTAKSRCWADGDSFGTVLTLYGLEEK